MEKLKIIALMGKSKAGKNTAGDMLCEITPTATTLAFADKLKAIAGEMFGLPHAALYTEVGKEEPTDFPCLRCPVCGKLDVDDVSTLDQALGRCKICGNIGSLSVFKSFWTGRTIAQHIGTEGFRRVWPNVWASFAIKAAATHLGAGCGLVVITDCRFKNEVEAVRNAGGEIWRIKRSVADSVETGIAGHASEKEQESIPDSQCNAVIINDGTLESLRATLAGELVRFHGKYAS